MLTRLLSRRARQEEEEGPVEAQAPAAVLSREDALLLFVPESGGMSFRLFTVQNEETAEAFVRQEFPQLGGKPLLFRPFRAGARVDADQQGEVLVVIADPSRPGTVYLSAFEDTDSAESFARFEVRNGLDPNLVSVHPGMPIIIETAPAAGPYSTPVAARPAPVAATSLPRTAAPPVTPPRPVTAPQPLPAVTARVAPVAAAATPQPRVAPQVRVSAAQPQVAAQPKAKAKVKAAPQTTKAPRPGIVDSIREWPGWDTLPARVKGASMLKWETYDEMRTDAIGDSQARVIVAAAAAAAGIGAFWAGPVAMVLYALAGLLGWLASAYLTHYVGTVFFPGRQSQENKRVLFKTLSFANAPRMLVVIGLVVGAFLPLMPLIVLGVLIWSLVAMVLATEYSLEIDRQSATLTALTSWLALFAISFVLPALIV